MYPRTFREFYEQFPNIIGQIICKSRWVDFDDVADLEQEILSEIIRKNVVEKFNPDLYDRRVNTAMFIAYIKNCATRLFLTIQNQSNRPKRSINSTAVSLAEPVSDKGRTKLIGDTIHDGNRAQRAIEASLEFEQFASYVISEDPALTSIINAIRDLGSTNAKDIAKHIGMKYSTATGRMAKVMSLARRWNAK